MWIKIVKVYTDMENENSYSRYIKYMVLYIYSCVQISFHLTIIIIIIIFYILKCFTLHFFFLNNMNTFEILCYKLLKMIMKESSNGCRCY